MAVEFARTAQFVMAGLNGVGQRFRGPLGLL